MWKSAQAKKRAARLEPRLVADDSPDTKRPRDTGRVAGSTLRIRGNVTGAGNFVLQGRLHGNVSLTKGSLTIGAGARVIGDLNAREVIIAGEVEGQVSADESVLLRSTAKVTGNVKAPRAAIEAGGKIKGVVDTSAEKPVPRSEPVTPVHRQY